MKLLLSIFAFIYIISYSREFQEFREVQEVQEVQKIQKVQDLYSPPPPELPDINLYRINTREKYIVLSIDDGPSYYTNTILDILSKNNIRANFFLVGSEVESYPYAVRKIGAGGHEIGIHSYTHNNFIEMSPEDIYNMEILPFEEIIKDKKGIPAAFIRPPYGAITREQGHFLKDMGYHIISWSLDTKDWKFGWEDSLEVLKKNKHRGAIILMHSNKKAPYLLPELIRELKSSGYTFITLGDYFGKRPLPKKPYKDKGTLWEKRREFLKGSIKKEDL